MHKSKAYSAVDVKNVDLVKVLAGREGQEASLGIDMSKKRPVLMLRWGERDFERPWSARNPEEIGEVVELAQKLGAHRRLLVAMEPTGSYGDPLRQALSDAKVELRRVSPKATHDYAEIFDGVPSQHDGKDAAIVAEVAAIGKSVVWKWQTPEINEQRMAFHVDWIEANRKILSMWCGRLEGLLARYWPEVLGELPLSRAVLLRALMKYGGPERLAEDPEGARQLARWGRARLELEKIERIMAGAAGTRGVRQTKMDRHRVRACAKRGWQARGSRERSARALAKLSSGNRTIQAMGQVVGISTACALWVCLGDPHDYPAAAGYRKAMGLNLAERSSGEQQGRLHISKRGSSLVRQRMYLAALRWIRRSPQIGQWYRTKRQWVLNGARDDPSRRKATGLAVVAVMRRLALEVHLAALGQAFDPARLFPGGAAAIRRLMKRGCARAPRAREVQRSQQR
jgi:transposase